MYDCIVYVAGPYNGNVETNVEVARQFSDKLWAMGFPTICPHMNSYRGGAPEYNYPNGYAIMVTRADVVLLLPNWHQSPGTLQELKATKKHGYVSAIYEWQSLGDLVRFCTKKYPWVEEEKSPRVLSPNISDLLKMADEQVSKMMEVLAARQSSSARVGIGPL